MAHWIECLIYSGEFPSPIVSLMKTARTVSLDQGFVALRVDAGLLNEFQEIHNRNEPLVTLMLGSNEGDPVPIALLEAVSQHHLVAYVRTRYFGGAGEQAAGVWEKGQAVFGPTFSEGVGAINSALKGIGVIRGNGAMDEFESLGLGRVRAAKDFDKLGKD